MLELNILKLERISIIKILLKILALFITVLLVIFIVYALRMGVLQEQDKFINEMNKFGILAPIIFLLLQLVQVVFPIIPGGTSCLIGVLFFGPFYGFICNYIGIIIGSILAYNLSKRYGLKVIGLFFKEETIDKYLSYISNDRFLKIFLVGILLPGFPDDLLCYMAGISKIKWNIFVWSIILGKFFSVFMYSYLINLI